MATIYSDNNDGYVRGFSTVNWATAKALTTGSSASSTATYYNFAIQSGKVTLRGGTVLYVNTRSCFEFDTSSISETPTAATLNIYGTGASSGDFFVIASTQGSTLGTGDFDAMVLSGVPGSYDGSGGGDIESYVTKYSAEVTSWNILAYNSITLNSAALSQIASASTFKIMCMESVHDMRDIEPSANNRSGAFYANNTGTSQDPYLDVTEAVTADNATFFGCNF